MSSYGTKLIIFYLIAEFDLLVDERAQSFRLADKMRKAAEENLPNDKPRRENVLLEECGNILPPENVFFRT